MTNHTFTVSDIKQKLIDLAAGSPDFQYRTANKIPEDVSTGCYYIKDGEPSCIVGQALSLLGVQPDEFTEQDSARNVTCEILGINRFEVDAKTREDLEWIDLVQSHQDSNMPWSECITYANQNVQWHV